jgi:hypothetical protein
MIVIHHGSRSAAEAQFTAELAGGKLPKSHSSARIIISSRYDYLFIETFGINETILSLNTKVVFLIRDDI